MGARTRKLLYFWIGVPNIPVPQKSVLIGGDSAYSTRRESVIGCDSPLPDTVYPTQAVVPTLAVSAAEPFHHQLTKLDDTFRYRNAQDCTEQNSYERRVTSTAPPIVGSTIRDRKLERRNYKSLPQLSIPSKPIPYPKCNWADMRPESPLRNWPKRGKKEETNLRGGQVVKYYGERSRHHERLYSKAVHTLLRQRQRVDLVRAQDSTHRADLKRTHESSMRRQRKQIWRRDCQRDIRSRAAFVMQSGNTNLDPCASEKKASPFSKQEPGLDLPESSLP